MSDRGWVVVTGASSGIGQACVLELQSAGYKTLGVDIAPASNADLHLNMDLARSDCGGALARAIEGLKVVGLVNNAGVAVYRPAEETSVEVWDLVHAVNLRSAFLLTQAAVPNLRLNLGSVVNVASVHAVATSTGVAAYAAAKGGLVALTRALAIELAPAIRVNAVLPGAIDTPMLANGLFRTKATVESLASKHPLHRIGDPTDIAQAVLFLLEKGPFITGATLQVDGGALAHLSTE